MHLALSSSRQIDRGRHVSFDPAAKLRPRNLRLWGAARDIEGRRREGVEDGRMIPSSPQRIGRRIHEPTQLVPRERMIARDEEKARALTSAPAGFNVHRREMSA
jgi:hypothetical protein